MIAAFDIAISPPRRRWFLPPLLLFFRLLAFDASADAGERRRHAAVACFAADIFIDTFHR